MSGRKAPAHFAKHLARQILVAPAGLVAVLSGAGLVGIWFAPLEIAQAPAPHLGALSLALGILLSIFRVWRWVLAMLVCLLWQVAL